MDEKNIPNYRKLCDIILAGLPQKHKEVLLRRFGLKNGEKETLEKIGQDFGITRERVRQIEADAFSRITENKENKEIKKAFFDLENYFKNNGGLKREDITLSSLGGTKFQNSIYFLLTVGDKFYRFSETNDSYPFWTIDKNLFQSFKNILTNLVKGFEKEKKPVSEQEFSKFAKNEKPEIFLSSIEIAKRIEKGPLGEYGLVDWADIKPKGVKDRAFLALNKEKKPLHFREIAKLASEVEGGIVNKKKVYPQTVHNELIKDPRFVLVGRGIYALKDWGYNTGTVKDVISEVLKKSKNALSKEQIVEQVLSQRMVKENTILLNLQDKSLFQKNLQGKYIIRKA